MIEQFLYWFYERIKNKSNLNNRDLQKCIELWENNINNSIDYLKLDQNTTSYTPHGIRSFIRLLSHPLLSNNQLHIKHCIDTLFTMGKYDDDEEIHGDDEDARCLNNFKRSTFNMHPLNEYNDRFYYGYHMIQMRLQKRTEEKNEEKKEELLLTYYNTIKNA
jgi:hypothetical protein